MILDSIKSYTALIDQNVQSLMHMYFNSAYKNLDYALIASADNRKSYLLQARNCFIDATNFEKNENLILSLVGLALCQTLTNDMDNSLNSLQRVKNVDFSLPNENEIEEMPNMKYVIIRYLQDWRHAINGVKKEIPIERANSSEEQYYIRFRNILIGLNFSLFDSEEELTKKFNLAAQKISKEDFESFKSDIIVQFGL